MNVTLNLHLRTLELDWWKPAQKIIMGQFNHLELNVNSKQILLLVESRDNFSAMVPEQLREQQVMSGVKRRNKNERTM
jgi:hypothetical protein